MKHAQHIDDLIIDIFKKSKDNFVSGQTLSDRIKITRTAVWKHIEGLRKKGYIITSVPSKGYKLVEAPDKLSVSEIKGAIKTRIIGSEIFIFDEVDSTNDIAMKMGAEGREEGLVVLSEGQLHGRGRLGRTWVSPKGVNLYVSILLRPEISPFYAPVLTMMAAMAAAGSILKTTGLKAKIKWPNDILVDQKKVAGILTEMNAEQEKINYIVIGIGINVNMKKEDFPEDLRMPAASLMECAGRRVDRAKLLCALLESMEEYYEELKSKGIMSIVQKWRRLCGTLNKRIKVSLPGGIITGIAEDVTQEGGLVIRTGNGSTKVIFAGDVTLLEE